MRVPQERRVSCVRPCCGALLTSSGSDETALSLSGGGEGGGGLSVSGPCLSVCQFSVSLPLFVSVCPHLSFSVSVCLYVCLPLSPPALTRSLVRFSDDSNKYKSVFFFVVVAPSMEMLVSCTKAPVPFLLLLCCRRSLYGDAGLLHESYLFHFFFFFVVVTHSMEMLVSCTKAPVPFLLLLLRCRRSLYGDAGFLHESTCSISSSSSSLSSLTLWRCWFPARKHLFHFFFFFFVVVAHSMEMLVSCTKAPVPFLLLLLRCRRSLYGDAGFLHESTCSTSSSSSLSSLTLWRCWFPARKHLFPFFFFVVVAHAMEMLVSCTKAPVPSCPPGFHGACPSACV